MTNIEKRIAIAESNGWKFVNGMDGKLLKIINPSGIWFGGNVDLFALAGVPDYTEETLKTINS